MKIDWDPEARRGTLTLWTEESVTSTGECMAEVVLNEDELIALYRVLKDEIGEYVAKMDSYAAEFAAKGTVGGWAPPERDDLDDLDHPSYDALAERADHDRKVAKGE